jgi:AcrR family transcriptional regulator
MRKNHPVISRDVILAAALKILNDDGLEGLSMRKLAAALDIEAMSLYNHVKDKRDLLDGLVDRVLSQIELPDDRLAWDRRLELIALGLYAALVQHPALVIVMATEKGQPTDLRVLKGMDSLVAILAVSGLNPALQVSAYRGLLATCFGFVLAATQGLSKTQAQAQEDWETRGVQAWNAEALPHLAGLAPQFLQTHADDDYKFMLGAYLAALKTESMGN